MFASANLPIVLGAILLGMLVHALMYSAQPAIMTEMFPTRMRYSGVSLGYQVTAIVAGSWAPLIGTALLRQYNDWMPIAIYIATAGAISLAAALVMTETRGISLLAIDSEDQRRFATPEKS
jgi:MFS family permease